MIEKIIAKIESVFKEYIIVNLNNLFFKINVASPDRYEINKEYLINLVTEYKFDRNEINLYGFINNGEKELFLALRQIQGIGPKLCLAILNKDEPEVIIHHILINDQKYLSSIPRISNNMAEKITSEFIKKYKQNKIKTNFDNLNILANSLTELGYKKNQIKEILPLLNPNLELDILIKEAIKMIKND